MPGAGIQLPKRVFFDEVIGTGQSQASGITGYTTKSYGSARYNSWLATLPPSTSAYALAATVSSSNGTTTITTGLANPDFPRAVKVCASTSQLASGNVVVSGTNQWGASVSDTIALGAAGATGVDGAVAFKTITSVVLPAATSRNAGTSGAAPSVTLGLSNIFGLDRQIDSVAACIRGAKNGTAETTAPIMNTTNHTVSFTNSATSSATAKMEVIFLPQDTSHV